MMTGQPPLDAAPAGSPSSSHGFQPRPAPRTHVADITYYIVARFPSDPFSTISHASYCCCHTCTATLSRSRFPLPTPHPRAQTAICYISCAVIYKGNPLDNCNSDRRHADILFSAASGLPQLAGVCPVPGEHPVIPGAHPPADHRSLQLPS